MPCQFHFMAFPMRSQKLMVPQSRKLKHRNQSIQLIKHRFS